MMRYLRYAAAIGFALFALALIGLWVNSYQRWSTFDIALHGSSSLRIYTSIGIVDFSVYSSAAPHVDYGYRGDIFWPWHNGTMGFDHSAGFLYRTVTVPFWFMTAVSVALALFLGCKRLWRFTVRGLIIATTILAVLLGFAVYATS